MADLLDNPARARAIADNSVRTFRERYLTPAAEACYWRALFNGYGSVFNETEDDASDSKLDELDEKGMRFESYVLLPSADMMKFKMSE